MRVRGRSCRVQSYIEFRTVRPDLPPSIRGEAADTVEVFGLAQDYDADTGKIADLPISASLITETSPGNRHNILLTERLPISDATEIGARMRALGGDHDTGNPVQPYRISGTPNYPNLTKQQRGRIEVTSTRILEYAGAVYTAEQLRTAFPAAKHKANVNGHASGNGAHQQTEWKFLPDSLKDLIRNGVGEGERSDQFHHAVGWLKQLHWTADDIVELLERFPNGIAHKYLRHLNREVDRSYEKCDEPPPSEEPKGPLIKSGADFVAGFVPPDYVLVGIVVRRYLYSLTGQTGAGKTAIMLLLAACVAQGKDFAGRITKKARVLYAAAENPDDVRMRWIALAELLNFDPSSVEVYFTEGRFNIAQMASRLQSEAEAIGGKFGLVIVDTSPAFFLGDDENSRAQMGVHARMLRSLINVVPGGPAIIANCHPIKNAASDNLLPAGGGTFLNEVDGNLICAKGDSVSELHWQGKFRGPEFAPMNFLIKTVTVAKVQDSDGRHLPVALAEWISDEGRDQMQVAALRDEDQVLELIQASPKASIGSIATSMGWKYFSGEPNRSRAQRCVDKLLKAKLITRTRAGHWKPVKKQERDE
jgi:AAA domain